MAIPTNIKTLQDKSRDLQVRHAQQNVYVVTSSSNPAVNHIVTVEFDEDREVHARCTCSWARHNGIACSHVLATLEYLAALKERTLSFWTNEDDARRQKHRLFKLVGDRSKKQVWITSRNAATR